MKLFELSQIVTNHLFENQEIKKEVDQELEKRINRSSPKDDNDPEYYKTISQIYKEILEESVKRLTNNL